MHVAFLNRSYYPDTTATGQLLTDLCEDLVRNHGCRVSVVAGPAGPARETKSGVEIHRVWGTRFDKSRFAGRASNYLTYFASATWAGLRLDRPDVIVALTDPPIIGLAAWAAGKRFGAPFVMAFKDLFPEVTVLLPDFHSDAINAVLQGVNRFLVRRAAANVALGPAMRQRLIDDKGAPPDRTAIIADWADTTSIAPGPKRNDFSRRHGLADAFVVMHSGNVGLSQGLDTLVDAAARLTDLTDLQVVIVGEGVSKSALQDRVRALSLSNVQFLPFTPREELSDSFATADVFVVSLQRGMAGYIVPSKLYGILAAGRPYVAAVEEACEVAALTRDHQCGLLAEPGDAVMLAERIRKFYNDRALASRCGANARAVSLSFDRASQVAKYVDLFRRVANESGNGFPESIPGFVKRAFDVLLAGIGLILSLPLWAVIAAAVKFEDGGPVFYAQERVGRGGRRFRALKFRSMVPDAEAMSGARQAGPGDPRTTKVGRWLRATAMDELPQLLSIFRGDMSFVGPRALRPGEIEVRGSGIHEPLEAVPGFDKRCTVRPGLTGVAQVFAPRDIPRRDKFKYDLLYIRRQSFALDMRLIILSFWITFRGTWEVRGKKF